jgi:hypothetical protein
MNCFINVFSKKINHISIKNSINISLKVNYLSNLSFARNALKNSKKLFKNNSIFVRQFKLLGGNAPLKKEKLNYNGIRRLLALAKPEKYKLMGKIV